MRTFLRSLRALIYGKPSKFLDEEKTRLNPDIMKVRGRDYAVCPACDSDLLEGPSGGLSTNLYCSDSKGCGARWNYSGFIGLEAINDEAEECLKHMRLEEQQ